MGVLINKKRIRHEVRALAFVDLFIALAGGLSTTVWSLYIDSFVHSTVLTGLVSGLLTFISILSYFLFIPLIERSDKGKLFGLSLLWLGFFYFILAFNKSFYFFLAIAIIITFLYAIRISTFGIMVKDKSKKKELAKNEGLIYTFLNLGWLLGPLAAGYIANRFGIEPIFILTAIITLLSFVLFKYLDIKDKHIKKETDGSFIKNFIDFFRNRERFLAYIIDGGAAVWWVLIYLYMPLFIVEKGLGDIGVGYFLFALALPLIALEYPFSKLTARYGFKSTLKIGFIFVAFFALASFFATNVYLILLILVISSFGMALLEPTTEAYFLSVIKNGEASRFYGPFNTTRDITQFIAKILSSAILIVLPFKFIFLFFGFVMFLMFLAVFLIKEDAK